MLRTTKYADSRGLRPKLLVGAFIAAIALAAPTMVMARVLNDVFADVPNSNPFHDDIGAIAKAGVTTTSSSIRPTPAAAPASSRAMRGSIAARWSRARR